MIKNISKKTVLCTKAIVLKSILSKAIGLMFSGKIQDTGLIFMFSNPRRMDMHMLFVFFPIDVLFLDESKKVVEIKENFRPFAFYLSREKAVYVIELPEGVIRKSRTGVGDFIDW